MKKAEKKGKKELIDDSSIEKASTIESSLALHEVKLKGQEWTAKFTVESELPQSYRMYGIKLEYNELPIWEVIDQIERDLSEGLFKDDAAAKKNAMKSIEKHKERMEKEHAQCEDIEFSALVLELKYTDKGTQLTTIIPDSVIEPLNRQKARTKLYKISLVPKFV